MITYRRPSLLSGPLAASTGVAVWRPRAAYNENDVNRNALPKLLLSNRRNNSSCIYVYAIPLCYCYFLTNILINVHTITTTSLQGTVERHTSGSITKASTDWRRVSALSIKNI